MRRRKSLSKHLRKKRKKKELKNEIKNNKSVPEFLTKHMNIPQHVKMWNSMADELERKI
jgi:phage terminase large subunit-like protein